MAELGESGDPFDLVPGDPDAVARDVTAIRGRSRAMDIAGDDLRRIDTGGWQGAAGNAFRDRFSYEPARWYRAADAFAATARALEGYAFTLRWAQAEAREAIHLWNEGQEATRVARSEHNQALSQVEGKNRSNAAAGDPGFMRVAPFTDPGEAMRQAARERLNEARTQLAEAGDRAAGTILDNGNEAPETSAWEDAGNFIGDFATGAWDTVGGTAQLLWDISPHHLVTDIDAYGETWQGLGGAVASAATDPVEFGKQIIGWEHWTNGEPGRALGQVAGGAVLGYGVGKVASSLHKLRPAPKLPQVKPSPFDESKTLERGGNPRVRLVDNEGQLREIFDRWKDGARQLPSRGSKVPEVYELEDGTIIQWRTTSRSGGQTIDLVSPSGNDMKIHVK